MMLTSKAKALVILALVLVVLGLLLFRIELLLSAALIFSTLLVEAVLTMKAIRKARVVLKSRGRIPDRVIVDSLISVKVVVGIEGFSGLVKITDRLSGNLELVEGSLDKTFLLKGNGGDVGLEYTIKALVRGSAGVGPLTVTLMDPLGLVGDIRVIDGSQVFFSVVPQFYTYWFKEKTRTIRRILPPGGHPIHAKGFGVELEYIRQYMPGDDYKRIAWTVSARSTMGELYVKETSSDVRLNLFIVLDVGLESSLGYPRRLIDYYVEATGALILSALKLGDTIGVYIAGIPSLLLPPTRRREYLYMVLKHLEILNPTNTKTMLSRVPSILSNVLTGKALVIYMSSLENIENIGRIVDETRALGHIPLFILPYTPSFIRIPRDKAELVEYYGILLGKEAERIRRVKRELLMHGARVVIVKPVDFVPRVLEAYYNMRF